MNIVPVIKIVSSMIVSTNVADVDDYDAGATYAEGNTAKDPITYVEYESQVDGNTNNDPTQDDGSNWLKVGYANSRRMFDGFLKKQSEKAEAIIVDMDIGELFTTVSVHSVEASSVTLSLSDGGVEVYSETINLVESNDVENIWDYVNTAPSFKTEAVFTSVPGRAGYTAKLTVLAPGSTAKIGEAYFGYGRQIGTTLEGSGPRIKDYSTVEANDFGEQDIVVRPYGRGAVFVVGMNPLDSDRITRIMAQNRSKVCVFFPEVDMEHYGLTVVGIYKDFEPGLTHRGIIEVTIPVEGIAE